MRCSVVDSYFLYAAYHARKKMIFEESLNLTTTTGIKCK